MKIAVGCDPNAEEFKQQLIPFIEKLGHEVTDFGSDDSIYANVAIEVAENVAAKKFERGILFCGTGIGVMLAANKVKGIRCALCTDVTMARLTREHNDANMLSMGQRTTGIETCKDIVHTFLNTPFSEGERHKGRIAKISAIEDAQ